MQINTNTQLYLYASPSQNAQRKKINKPKGTSILIGRCNKYGWCITKGGYIKRMWIKEKEEVHINETKNLQDSEVNVALLKTKETRVVTKPDKKNLIERIVSKKIDTPIVKTEDNKQKESDTFKITKNKNYYKSYFLHGSIGTTKMSVTQTDQIGSIYLGTKPEDKGLTLNIGLGYHYSFDYFSTIDLDYKDYNDVRLYNYIVTLNKKLSDSVYLGIIGGISNIELRKKHINLPLSDKYGKEYLYGLQLGYEYLIQNNYSIYLQYRYSKAKHITSLESAPVASNLIRDDYSSFLFGFKWMFDFKPWLQN